MMNALCVVSHTGAQFVMINSSLRALMTVSINHAQSVVT